MRTIFRLIALSALSIAATSYADSSEARHPGHGGARGVQAVAQQARTTAQAARQVAQLASYQNPRYAQFARGAAQSCRQLAMTANRQGRGRTLAAAHRNCQDAVSQVKTMFTRFRNRISSQRLAQSSRQLFQEANILNRKVQRMRNGGGRGHGGGWGF